MEEAPYVTALQMTPTYVVLAVPQMQVCRYAPRT